MSGRGEPWLCLGEGDQLASPGGEGIFPGLEKDSGVAEGATPASPSLFPSPLFALHGVWGWAVAKGLLRAWEPKGVVG